MRVYKGRYKSSIEDILNSLEKLSYTELSDAQKSWIQKSGYTWDGDSNIIFNIDYEKFDIIGLNEVRNELKTNLRDEILSNYNL
jgi:hypothetical protein